MEPAPNPPRWPAFGELIEKMNQSGETLAPRAPKNCHFHIPLFPSNLIFDQTIGIVSDNWPKI